MWLVVFCSFNIAVYPATAADLDLTLSNIKSIEGKLMLQMVSSEAAFKGEENNTYMSLIIPLQSPETRVSVGSVQSGEYAIRVFHDTNSNQKLDSNLLGIPNEPFGFSNDATGNFGPAKWKDAKFTVPDSGVQLIINLSD